jgi:H+/Cl- antiporter ClcA
MPEWLKPYLDTTRPESPKALILWQSAVVLAAVTFGLALAVIWTACFGSGVPSGLVTAFVFSAGVLGGLAGFHNQGDSVPPEAKS